MTLLEWLCFVTWVGQLGLACLSVARTEKSVLAKPLALLCFVLFAWNFAEWAHREVRTRLWGTAPAESLDNMALIAEEYAGIRPAPGYPACPDHTEKETIFRVLDATARTGITLTESMAMTPTAAVSGWYFGHPRAAYFGVGKIGRDQLADYAARKGWTPEEAERWLRPNLA